MCNSGKHPHARYEELRETPETSSSAATSFSPFVIFMQMSSAAALIIVFGQLSARNQVAFLDPPLTGEQLQNCKNASQPLVGLLLWNKTR